MVIKLKNQEIYLLPQKAIWWPTHRALLIADLHLGKIERFRKGGIPLPQQATQKSLQLLMQVIDIHQPDNVYFLGDLFHSQYNTSVTDTKDFFESYPDIHWVLIQGNHDIMSADIYRQLNIAVVKDLIIEDFLLTHEPISDAEDSLINICGHIHPGVRIKGRGKQSLTLPCFYHNKNTIILPAFGYFTGKALLEIFDSTKIYAVTEEKVFLIPRKNK